MLLNNDYSVGRVNRTGCTMRCGTTVTNQIVLTVETGQFAMTVMRTAQGNVSAIMLNLKKSCWLFSYSETISN